MIFYSKHLSQDKSVIKVLLELEDHSIPTEGTVDTVTVKLYL